MIIDPFPQDFETIGNARLEGFWSFTHASESYSVNVVMKDETPE